MYRRIVRYMKPKRIIIRRRKYKYSLGRKMNRIIMTRCPFINMSRPKAN
jgi:hypothetical protein